jgi:hypothetical protein
MKAYSTLSDASLDLISYAPPATIAADTVAMLNGARAAVSAVERLCNSVEVIYARKSEFDDNGIQLASGLALFCEGFQWLQLRGGRGTQISQTLQGTLPAGTTAPEPLSAYVRPPTTGGS